MNTTESVFVLKKIQEVCQKSHMDTEAEALEMGIGALEKKPLFGKWIDVPSGLTPGGTPVYACGHCGGTEHLYGVEFPKRKMVCDRCGSINSYPWEKTRDESNGEE